MLPIASSSPFAISAMRGRRASIARGLKAWATSRQAPMVRIVHMQHGRAEFFIDAVDQARIGACTGLARIDREAPIVEDAIDIGAVSYTHLTLPTIYSV